MTKVAAVSVAIGIALAAVAQAAIVQTFEVIPRPNKASKKGKPKNISLRVRIGIRDDAGAKPSPLRKVVVR